jgi:hypothetical protein
MSNSNFSPLEEPKESIDRRGFLQISAAGTLGLLFHHNIVWACGDTLSHLLEVLPEGEGMRAPDITSVRNGMLRNFAFWANKASDRIFG